MQTHANWIAHVFDDSPDREGRDVVGRFNDSRIVYAPNATRLGGAANLDRAFQTRPYSEGRFACVCEDDNWLLPEFIEANLATAAETRSSVLLRNQLVWRQEADGGWMTGQTTRGTWLEEGRVEPRDLRALLLMMEGISNGGLFWSTDTASDLQVGERVTDSGLQEYCRTLQIREPLHFASQPMAVWSQMPSQLVTRSANRNAVMRAGQAQIARYVLDRWGDEVLPIAEARARAAQQEHLLARRLVYARPLRFGLKYRHARWIARGTALRFVRQPLRGYFAERGSQLQAIE